MKMHLKGLAGIAVLGLMMGVVIAMISKPQLGYAQPESALHGGYSRPDDSIISVRWQHLNWPVQPESEVRTGWAGPTTFLQHDRYSSSPGSGQPILVGGRAVDELLADLESVRIGQEIIIEAAHNGLYHYRVLEVRTTTPERLDHLVPADRESVLLFTSPSPWSRELLVVIAYPVSTLLSSGSPV